MNKKDYKYRIQVSCVDLEYNYYIKSIDDLKGKTLKSIQGMDGTDEMIRITDNNNNTLFYADASTAITCCGILEIGDFQFHRSHKSFNEENIKAILKWVFSKLFVKGITNVIYTIHIGHMAIIEEILAGLPTKYKKVKTFTNTNTGNEVTCWVSKNK